MVVLSIALIALVIWGIIKSGQLVISRLKSNCPDAIKSNAAGKK